MSIAALSGSRHFLNNCKTTRAKSFELFILSTIKNELGQTNGDTLTLI